MGSRVSRCTDRISNVLALVPLNEHICTIEIARTSRCETFIQRVLGQQYNRFAESHFTIGR